MHATVVSDSIPFETIYDVSLYRPVHIRLRSTFELDGERVVRPEATFEISCGYTVCHGHAGTIRNIAEHMDWRTMHVSSGLLRLGRCGTLRSNALVACEHKAMDTTPSTARTEERHSTTMCLATLTRRRRRRRRRGEEEHEEEEEEKQKLERAQSHGHHTSDCLG